MTDPRRCLCIALSICAIVMLQTLFDAPPPPGDSTG
jgi:hypothetical protein